VTSAPPTTGLAMPSAEVQDAPAQSSEFGSHTIRCNGPQLCSGAADGAVPVARGR